MLVGQSYSGMVITSVAARLPERIAKLIYLDAFLPHDGESVNDIMVQARGRGYVAELEEAVRAAAMAGASPTQGRPPSLDRILTSPPRSL